ncbi:MAG: glycosyltransferase family 2 protein [Fibrobacterota bacterium]
MRKVTVCIITYNMSGYLERLIKALQEQTLGIENFDILIADDGSGDGTEELLSKKTFSGVIYKKFERYGRGNMRNFCLWITKTPWIAFTDADCIPEAVWLESLLSCAEKNGYSAVEGKTILTEPDRPMTHAVFSESGGTFLTCNILYKRHDLLVSGGFMPAMFMHEDTEAGLSVSENFPCGFSEDAVVSHPPRQIGFFKSLAAAPFEAREIFRAENLLSIRHPGRYGEVRWTPHCEEALKALAFKYSLISMRRFVKTYKRYPAASFFQLIIYLWKQLFIISNYLRGIRAY